MKVGSSGSNGSWSSCRRAQRDMKREIAQFQETGQRVDKLVGAIADLIRRNGK
jgi:hypothetical protein